jgi:hypothetical protein
LEYEDQHLQEHSDLALWRFFHASVAQFGHRHLDRIVVEIGSTWMHGLSAPVNPERLKGRRDKINQI